MNKNETYLLNDERLDDLQYKDLRIIQNKNMYCFSSDAVLLSNFVKAKRNDTIIDLCSGSGVVGILAQAKTGAQKLICIEKQKSMADMCARSFILNGITDRAEVINDDILKAPKLLGTDKYSVVCSNPPYYLIGKKKLSGDKCIDMSKFEIELSFDSLCETVSELLKFGGKFYFINDSSRIAELLSTLEKYSLSPKVINFVFPKKGEESNVVLIEATKHGKAGAKVFAKNI